MQFVSNWRRSEPQISQMTQIFFCLEMSICAIVRLSRSRRSLRYLRLNKMPLYGLYEGVQFEWFGQEIGHIFPGELAIYFCFAVAGGEDYF